MPRLPNRLAGPLAAGVLVFLVLVGVGRLVGWVLSWLKVPGW